MTSIETKIPDALYRQAQAIAQREDISLDELIAIALASQVSGLTKTPSLRTFKSS